VDVGESCEAAGVVRFRADGNGLRFLAGDLAHPLKRVRADHVALLEKVRDPDLEPAEVAAFHQLARLLNKNLVADLVQAERVDRLPQLGAVVVRLRRHLALHRRVRRVRRGPVGPVGPVAHLARQRHQRPLPNVLVLPTLGAELDAAEIQFAVWGELRDRGRLDDRDAEQHRRRDVPRLMRSCAADLGQSLTDGGIHNFAALARSAARTSARISGFIFSAVA
jgi:hypothetical protein